MSNHSDEQQAFLFSGLNPDRHTPILQGKKKAYTILISRNASKTNGDGSRKEPADNKRLDSISGGI